MGSVGRRVYSCKQRERNSQSRCIDSEQISLNDKYQQVHIVCCAPGRNLLSTVTFVCWGGGQVRRAVSVTREAYVAVSRV